MGVAVLLEVTVDLLTPSNVDTLARRGVIATKTKEDELFLLVRINNRCGEREHMSTHLEARYDPNLFAR